MALKKKLMADRKTSYFISDDIPFEVRGLRQKLKNIKESATKLNIDSRVVGNKILLNGKIFTATDLDGLNDDLLDGAAQIKKVEGGLAYRGEEAFLSNFHYAPFVLDDHRFVSVEQYYQYKKCLRLGHINMAAKILRTPKPLQAKTLGDKFDDTESDDWMEDRAQCMLNGTVAKFTQNPGLAKRLIDTGECGLYEATTDKYFGAGIGLGSNLWLTGNWTGENAAGKICMNVKSLLNNEVAHGANLEDIGGIITYPVSPARIPGAIDIQSEYHSGPPATEEDDSVVESEKEEVSSSEEEESDMDTGTQDEVLSQVETEPKDRDTEINQDNALEVTGGKRRGTSQKGVVKEPKRIEDADRAKKKTNRKDSNRRSKNLTQK